jgi:hypothetical protein
LTGVSSSKISTRSTQRSADSSMARSSAGMIGLLCPFNRRTLSSELMATIR